MIIVKVNKNDPTDLYEQVAAEIRRALADGEAKPGERRLPPAKDLAAVLGVNTNTVLRSLRALAQPGSSTGTRQAAQWTCSSRSMEEHLRSSRWLAVPQLPRLRRR
jgi:DNA-binding transcriptional regulator YhcF (GntR family)